VVRMCHLQVGFMLIDNASVTQSHRKPVNSTSLYRPWPQPRSHQLREDLARWRRGHRTLLACRDGHSIEKKPILHLCRHGSRQRGHADWSTICIRCALGLTSGNALSWRWLFQHLMGFHRQGFHLLHIGRAILAGCQWMPQLSPPVPARGHTCLRAYQACGHCVCTNGRFSLVGCTDPRCSRCGCLCSAVLSTSVPTGSSRPGLPSVLPSLLARKRCLPGGLAMLRLDSCSVFWPAFASSSDHDEAFLKMLEWYWYRCLPLS
jgi:hypothetical protein